jgi:AbrB family looped-hinge helix DNA binding protein
MTELVLDDEGRIALPEDVRARLHLKPGDTVTVEISRPERPPSPRGRTAIRIGRPGQGPVSRLPARQCKQRPA